MINPFRLCCFALALLASGRALAVPTCTVASGGLLSFGNIVPLASTGDIGSNTGGSFWINCNNEVASSPAIHSASLRQMSSGISILPFRMSASGVGGMELAVTAPGTALDLARDGSNETVTLYGKILAADFKGLPSGAYSQVVMVTIEY